MFFLFKKSNSICYDYNSYNHCNKHRSVYVFYESPYPLVLSSPSTLLLTGYPWIIHGTLDVDVPLRSMDVDVTNIHEYSFSAITTYRYLNLLAADEKRKND